MEGRERFGPPAAKDTGPANTETALPSFSETDNEPVYPSPGCHSTFVHEEKTLEKNLWCISESTRIHKVTIETKGPSETAVAVPFSDREDAGTRPLENSVRGFKPGG